MTDMHLGYTGPSQEHWLKSYYFIRALVSAVWLFVSLRRKAATIA